MEQAGGAATSMKYRFQKPDEGAVRRVGGAFITSTPTVFVGKTSKSKDYRKDTSNEKPVNNTPGQRVDGRPKPHQ